MANLLLKASRSPCALLLSKSAIHTSQVPSIISRLYQVNRHTQISSLGTMAPANGDNGDNGELEGELNQWKFRAPYKVHESNEDFHARYEGSCHCGKVKYQLSREKPLDAKFCHCATCQKIHGRYMNPCVSTNAYSSTRGSLSMGCHLSQRRHQLH